MGVNNLNALIDKYAVTVPTKYNFKNKIFAIDASSVIYSSVINIKKKNKGDDMVNSKGEIVSHLYATMDKINNFMRNQINTFWIFDGGYPKFKVNAIQKRKYRKTVARNRLENCEKGNKEYIKFSKRCVKLTTKHYKQIMKLLTMLGIPYLIASGEADSQCVAMFKAGKVDGIISNDSDILTFGGSMLIKDFNFSKYSKILCLNKILLGLNFTHEQFIDFCIILGTDYSTGIRYIGKNKKNIKQIDRMYDLYKSFMDIPLLLEHIVNVNNLYIAKYNRLKYTIPADFLNFHKIIKNYYMTAQVIDPCDKNIVFGMKKPQKENIVQYLINDNNMHNVAIKIDNICYNYDKYNNNKNKN